MKKKLIRIVSLVMTAMLALGLFSGCSLGIFSDMGILVTDNQRDMQQVVAEVNLGKDKTSLEESFSLLSEELNSTVADQLDKVLTTDEIYKRDLVAYFMSYGYNYYSQNNSYTATFEQVMQDLVDRKIMSQFATVYYLNAGEVLVDRDNVTIKDGYVDISGTDGMKMNGEISLDGYLSAIEGKTGDEAAVAGYSYLLTDAEIKYATYVIMVSVNSAIDSYEEDNLFNKAFLPLKDRIRDFLILHFQLRMNGRSQLLKNEVQVYLPSVLAYDMKNGENCCKKAEYPVPEGYELVSGKVLKLWSDRLLENWNLYKQERNRKTPDSKPSAPPPPKAAPNQALIEREMEERIQEVVRNYETSTCWKLTKPIRALAKLFGKEGG